MSLSRLLKRRVSWREWQGWLGRGVGQYVRPLSRRERWSTVSVFVLRLTVLLSALGGSGGFLKRRPFLLLFGFLLGSVGFSPVGS